MDSGGASTKPPSTPCHLVAMPYAGRGHINPMMNLCKILSSKVNNNPNHLRITFVVTEEWLGLIGSETKPATITLATIPNVLPSEKIRAADMRSFLTATSTKMKDPFEQLLDRLEGESNESGVNVIVADSFLYWAVEVGNKRGIPVASFWPMSAITFGIFYNYDLIKRNGHHRPSKDRPAKPELQEEIVDYIPGISSVRVADLPIPSLDVIDDFVFPIFPCVKKAQYLLFPSVLELEPHIFRAIKQEFTFPVLSFGPLIPYFNIAPRTHDHGHYKWLDNQPPGSVIYVSMGSFLSVSDNELDEIAAGLDNSGVSYFWVARNDALKRQEIASNSGGGGLIVPWCDQLQVLSHPSIGGFWTHCGWSSTVEAIFAGVPMLTIPIVMDQFPNSKMIVDDWKIGSRVVEEANGLLMNRGYIAKVIKEFMDSEREERKEMLRNIKEIQKICRQAAQGDGSSIANIDSFLSGIGVFPLHRLI